MQLLQTSNFKEDDDIDDICVYVLKYPDAQMLRAQSTLLFRKLPVLLCNILLVKNNKIPEKIVIKIKIIKYKNKKKIPEKKNYKQIIKLNNNIK